MAGSERRVMQENKSEAKGGLTKVQLILIIGFVALAAVICIVGYILYNSMNKDPEPAVAGGNGNLVIDESNLAEVDEIMAQAVEEGMFEVNMNTIWNFPDGESPSSDAYVANGNANSRPISFDIILDGEECVYSSTVIPVGNRIKEIKLDKDLAAGQYNATCMYHLWNEDGTENSSFGVGIVLYIGK